VEDDATDWGGVLVAEQMNIEPVLTASVFASFSLPISTGRLAAGQIKERFGAGRVVL